MRRRVDIPPFPFLQPDGCMYRLAPDGGLVADGGYRKDSGLELGAITPSILSPAKDYTSLADGAWGWSTTHERGNDALLPNSTT